MKRTLVLMVLVAALILGSVASVSADVRLDFDVPWIVAAGLNVADVTGSSTVNVNLTNLHIPLPCVELAYQFGDGFLRGGIGVRAYTVLVEFVGWPMGYVEVALDRLVLRAELGGLGVFAFGVANGLLSTDFVAADLQAGYAVFPWLRLGAGVLIAAPPSNFSSNGWLFYVNARFAFDFK